MEGLKTVIVDPDRRTRDFVESTLRSRGMLCRGFASGGEALDACRALSPDLLLVEADLPDTSGFALVLKLRDLAPDAEVCLLSTNTSYDNAVQGLRLGVSDYLLKPLTEAQLEAAVERSKSTAELRRSRAAVPPTTELVASRTGRTPTDTTSDFESVNLPSLAPTDPSATANAVLRVLSGQPVESVASEIGVQSAELEAWRRAFVAAGRVAAGESASEVREPGLEHLTRRLDALTRELRATNELVRSLLDRPQT
jgi:DNA-binding response OmpR family regulator